VSAPDVTSNAQIDAFNQAAELYFASLTDWDHHLAKPFSNIDETPVLLMNLAVVLQALRLTPGMRVLEFGAGSGWLSRFLTQMGCQAVVLDVSETALNMARALYQRQPVIGCSPRPNSFSSMAAGSICRTAAWIASSASIRFTMHPIRAPWSRSSGGYWRTAALRHSPSLARATLRRRGRSSSRRRTAWWNAMSTCTISGGRPAPTGSRICA
jgi:hypothetical protein